MKYVIYAVVFISALLSDTHTAFAGSPGGLILAVTWTAATAPYISGIQGFFKRYGTPAGVHSCHGDQLNIESAAFKVDDRKINDDIIFPALSSPAKRRKLGTVLTKYRDKEHAQGFDGVLAIAREGDALVLRGMSALATEPIHTANISVVDAAKPAVLDAAICKVLIDLPTMREP